MMNQPPACLVCLPARLPLRLQRLKEKIKTGRRQRAESRLKQKTAIQYEKPTLKKVVPVRNNKGPKVLTQRSVQGHAHGRKKSVGGVLDNLLNDVSVCCAD